MSNTQYKIKNIKTGLYFSHLHYDRGLTKAGKPRKTGNGKFVAVFKPENLVPYTCIDILNNNIRYAIERCAENFSKIQKY